MAHMDFLVYKHLFELFELFEPNSHETIISCYLVMTGNRNAALINIPNKLLRSIESKLASVGLRIFRLYPNPMDAYFIMTDDTYSKLLPQLKKISKNPHSDEADVMIGTVLGFMTPYSIATENARTDVTRKFIHIELECYTFNAHGNRVPYKYVIPYYGQIVFNRNDREIKQFVSPIVEALDKLRPTNIVFPLYIIDGTHPKLVIQNVKNLKKRATSRKITRKVKK